LEPEVELINNRAQGHQMPFAIQGSSHEQRVFQPLSGYVPTNQSEHYRTFLIAASARNIEVNELDRPYPLFGELDPNHSSAKT
jgi:hypothetical protein